MRINGWRTLLVRTAISRIIHIWRPADDTRLSLTLGPVKQFVQTVEVDWALHAALLPPPQDSDLPDSSKLRSIASGWRSGMRCSAP